MLPSYADMLRSVMTLPFGGAVTQTISPLTSLFSTVINYKGVPAVERDVVEEVAGYGSQLGTVIDAVLVLAQGRNDPALDRLRDLALRIERVKQRHEGACAENAREALDALRRRDPREFRHLLAEYGRLPEPARGRARGAPERARLEP